MLGYCLTVLFEANTAGFDSFGIDVSTPVVHTFDTLNVYVRTPSGGLVHTISITGSGGQPFAEAATAAIPVLWPRYVVSAVIDSTGNSDDGERDDDASPDVERCLTPPNRSDFPRSRSILYAASICHRWAML